MRAHTNEEIINHALVKIEDYAGTSEDKIYVTVDMEEPQGTVHTYVVHFSKDDAGEWKPIDVSELSSL